MRPSGRERVGDRREKNRCVSSMLFCPRGEDKGGVLKRDGRALRAWRTRCSHSSWDRRGVKLTARLSSPPPLDQTARVVDGLTNDCLIDKPKCQLSSPEIQRVRPRHTPSAASPRASILFPVSAALSPSCSRSSPKFRRTFFRASVIHRHLERARRAAAPTSPPSARRAFPPFPSSPAPPTHILATTAAAARHAGGRRCLAIALRSDTAISSGLRPGRAQGAAARVQPREGESVVLRMVMAVMAAAAAAGGHCQWQGPSMKLLTPSPRGLERRRLGSGGVCRPQRRTLPDRTVTGHEDLVVVAVVGESTVDSPGTSTG